MLGHTREFLRDPLAVLERGRAEHGPAFSIDLFGERIAARRGVPVDPPDFLQHLATASYSDGEPVPNGVLVNMMLLLCWAGHETTVGQLAWTLADLLVSPAITHRMPEEFVDPERYPPSRFAADPQLTTRLHGFGGGLHRCLGMHFARTEIKVVVTRLLQRFDVEVLDRPRPVSGARTKWPAAPLRISYVTRKRAVR